MSVGEHCGRQGFGARRFVLLLQFICMQAFGQDSAFQRVRDPYFFMVEDVKATRVVGRGRSNSVSESLGALILTPLRRYRVTVYEPVGERLASIEFTTPSAGGRFQLPVLILRDASKMGFPDTDSDGLSDLVEGVIGTELSKPDSDGDGVTDREEARNGSNPLSRIVAAIDTPGFAKDLAVSNELALVADGQSGVGVFNVTTPRAPIRLAQVDIQGDASRVALSEMFGVACAGPGGLAVIALSDPERAKVTGKYNFGSNSESVAMVGTVAYVGLANGQIAVVDLEAQIEVERIFVSTNSVSDVSLSGTVLYAVTTGKLHAIPLASDRLTVSGVAPFNGSPAGGRRLRLFTGGGFAYVPTAIGVQIFSLADPERPVFVNISNVGQTSWTQIVANGSGLGLAAVGAGGFGDISLYGIGQNGVALDFRSTFQTTGSAEAVSIFNGFGFIADGAAGFSVVNYLASDTLRQPPGITLAPSFANGEAEEGKLVNIAAAVTDDVQVRNVEFYIDDQLVFTDGNFPFEHRFVTPLLATGRTSFSLRAKATDTGGNSTWSDSLVVSLKKDVTPPRAVRFDPKAGSSVGRIRKISVGFSEPMDPASLDADALVLTGAGLDGRFDTADDVIVVPDGGVQYLSNTRTAVINFSVDLPAANYRIAAGAPARDLAGNVISSPTSARFRTLDFADADRDGVPDDLEEKLGLNAATDDADGDGIKDGDEDFDNDGLGNAYEIALGLNPEEGDSDGNEISDGAEDWDFDGLTTLQEQQAGTDPRQSDTDGDARDDASEIADGTDPQSASGGTLTLVSAAASFLNALSENPSPGFPITAYSNAATYLNALPELGPAGLSVTTFSQPINYLNAVVSPIMPATVLPLYSLPMSFRNDATATPAPVSADASTTLPTLPLLNVKP